MNLFKNNQFFFLLHLAHIISMESIGWFTIFYFGNSWIPTIITALLLATSQAQAGWLQHDYGHLSIYKNSMWNHIVYKFIFGHLKGASANWWNHRHFQHHAKCVPQGSGCEHATCREYFFLIGPPLLIPLYFHYQTIMTMIVCKDWVDLAWAISYYTHFFITYIPFCDVLGAILFLNFIRFLESHCSQLAATCNVESSSFNDWLSGHLNFQIEHHLFPTMPWHNLHKITPLVRSLRAKHGIEYQEKPLLRALQDIIGSLRKSGQLWLDAYLHKRSCSPQGPHGDSGWGEQVGVVAEGEASSSLRAQGNILASPEPSDPGLEQFHSTTSQVQSL
ncbi:unnamed protein product [Rangifer tarandus platyrhynchus]|uniref:Fatty acid desaturase domain-containing protein n=1 Tax=Rangifer tarandus platyrhynchus TaxID=3082113 RepID=A0ABN8Y4F0_RANTA|nr:unnamed protein product [Rangifer tarandus platyrhynchus]